MLWTALHLSLPFSAVLTVVSPVFIMYFAARAEDAGLTGTSRPTASQSNSMQAPARLSSGVLDPGREVERPNAASAKARRSLRAKM
ncbi:MAG: hypothetical protein ACREFP_20105 [Acetobacteraceae bacterium]